MPTTLWWNEAPAWVDKQSFVYFAPRTNAALFSSACSCFLDPPEQTTKPTACRAAQEKLDRAVVFDRPNALLPLSSRVLWSTRFERKWRESCARFSPGEADTLLQNLGSLTSDKTFERKKSQKHAKLIWKWNCHDLIKHFGTRYPPLPYCSAWLFRRSYSPIDYHFSRLSTPFSCVAFEL